MKPTAAGGSGKHRTCLHLLVLGLVPVSILLASLLTGHLHFDSISSSPTYGQSVSGIAAAAGAQEEGVLRASVLPLTADAGESAGVVPLDAQPTARPEVLSEPPEPLMRALSVEPTGDEGTAAEAAEEAPAVPPPVYVVYTVQDGDTLSGVAAGYGISPSSIQWSNPGLESADSLVPGQLVRVPLSDGIVYDVAPGDTLSDIAARFAVDVQAIIDFPGNNLGSADSIVENQTIFIPNGTMPDTAPAETPTPEPVPVETPSPGEALPPPAPVPVPSPPVDPSGIGAEAAALARSRIGAAYAPGGAGPNVFDCSGLVYWVYSQLGVAVPRTSWEQYAWATPVDALQMEPGDLVFFANTASSGISHVGIYSGGGLVVMAVDDGDIVREVSLSEGYWSSHFAGAGRPP